MWMRPRLKYEESIEWRTGEGKKICEAARDAVAEATAEGAWTNKPVQEKAPHGSKINAFFAEGRVMNLRNKKGDGLIYAIRAGDIDDKALMSAVSVEELAEFFLYAKAINERSLRLSIKTDGRAGYRDNRKRFSWSRPTRRRVLPQRVYRRRRNKATRTFRASRARPFSAACRGCSGPW